MLLLRRGGDVWKLRVVRDALSETSPADQHALELKGVSEEQSEGWVRTRQVSVIFRNRTLFLMLLQIACRGTSGHNPWPDCGHCTQSARD